MAQYNFKIPIAVICISIILILSCSTSHQAKFDLEPCTDPWYHAVENQLKTGDSEGHGPDLGSEEWKSVIEFKLGVREDPTVPERSSNAWCTYIDVLIRDTY